jgi:hypothetical protein
LPESCEQVLFAGEQVDAGIDKAAQGQVSNSLQYNWGIA